jgi:acetyl-CoA carboxylase carboxyltransferase component
VKAATGEVVSAEDLGGADVHTRISGVADHYAENDATRCEIARAHRRQPQHGRSRSTLGPAATPEEPLYDPEEIYGVVPPTPASPTTCAR